MSWDCDLESPTAYREIRRRARKAHRCGDCTGQIQSGEHYLYISGIWDGEPSSYHRCYDCQHIRCEIRKETGDDNCMPLNGLRSWLEDYCNRATDSPWQRWAGMFNAVAAARESQRRITVTVEEPLCLATEPATAVGSTNAGDIPASASPSDCA